MVGYGPPIFYGHPGQAARRAEALGLLISCLEGPAKQWYETRIKGKNWKCSNISDNLGVANLTAVRTLAAGNGGSQVGGLNTIGQFQGKVASEIGRIGAGAATGADIIPNGTWDEDWSIASGESTNNAPVAPNAGGGFPAVTIAPNITLGQLIYLLKTAYTTVKHLKQTVVFGQLMQGDMGIEEFSAQIKKISKLARMTPEQQREQLIRGLSSMNQYNLRMMAKFHDTHDNIVDALAEAEKFTLSQKNAPSSIPVFPVANPYITNPYIETSKSGMTKNEIEDLIKTSMASVQPQLTQQNSDLLSAIKSLQKTMSRASKTLDNSKKLVDKKAEDHAIMRFLKDIARVRANEGLDEDYDYDPVDDIIDSMADMTLNSVTINAIKSAVRSAVKKCTKCSKFGYTSCKCPQKKKKKSKKSKKGNINLVIESDSSSDNTSSSDSSDSDTSSSDSSDSDGGLNVHIAKSKKK
ncbi:hypothetical protein RclHR1_21130007 [Rhizophagus clarus]|uniref:CCHC-type domain-containing protein n=1 Tax=Rhizophagus clarus TaxID=94130 RepID=A0A2Z6R5C6_9GLOM|nr:hypothetical protein RclHR1_21130007 [Rhizophagus clarus]